MIVSRMLLTVALVSSSVVVSMEKEQRQEINIQHVLNALIKPRQEGQLSDVELVELYLNNGGNINAKGNILLINPPYWQEMKDVNLLMVSAYCGRPRLMKFLVNECYARLDCTNEFGDTALMMATMNGRASLVRFLLRAGANKNIRNNYGITALDIAYNSPLRHDPFYNQKHSKNYHFPTMIKLLERPDKEKRQYYNEIDNAKNCSVLRITQ
jgi:hypothetical protein